MATSIKSDHIASEGIQSKPARTVDERKLLDLLQSMASKAREGQGKTGAEEEVRQKGQVTKQKELNYQLYNPS